jgi:hypothetical protein
VNAVLWLWALLAVIVLFALIGGVAISKFLFLLLVVALIVAIVGAMTRTT